MNETETNKQFPKWWGGKEKKVYSVDETTDAGLRVTGLGGIISILRFAVEAS